MQVLLFHPDNHVRDRLTGILAERGHAVEAKTAPIEAADLADVELALLGGPKAPRMVAALRDAHRTNGVALLGIAGDGDEERLLDVGAEDILDPAGSEALLIHRITLAEERIHAGAALRQARERYRGLLEQTNDIVYRHDLTGSYTDINEAGAALLGYTRDEIYRMRIEDLIHPDSAPIVEAASQRKLETGAPSTRYEIDVLHKDGSVLRLENHTRVVYENGEAVAIEGVARDVTARHAAEERLREKLWELESLYRFGEELRLANDVEHVCQATVEALKAVCGVDRAAVRLNHSGDRLLFADSSGLSETYLKAVEGLERRSLEERTAGPHIVQDVAWSIDPASLQAPMLAENVRSFLGLPMVANDTGEEVGRCAVYFHQPREVTAERIRLAQTVAGTAALAINRLRAADAVQTSEARFRAVTEGNLDAVFILEAERDDNGAIVDFVFRFANENGHRLLALDGRALIGGRLGELMPVNRTGGFIERYARVVETGEALVEDFEIDTPEIRASWLSHQAIKLGDGIALTTRDISAQKQAARDLAVSEEKYRALVEQTHDWLWVLDRADDGEFRFTFVNRAYTERTGRTLDDVYGKRVDEIGRKLSARPILRRMEEAVRTRQPVAYQQEVGTVDGDIAASVSISPLLDEDGDCYRLIVIAHDITHEQRARAAVERVGRILDESTNEVYTFDFETLRFVQANRAALDNLGYSAEELYQLTPLDLAVDITREQVDAALQPLLDGDERVVRYDLTHRRKDGSCYTLEAQVHLSFDGSRWLGVAICQDVTDLREHEIALRESEERFRTIFEAAPEAVLILRLSDGVVMDVNERFTDFSGHAAADVAGTCWSDLDPIARLGLDLDILERARDASGDIVIETHYQHLDGEPREAMVTLAAVELAGEPCALLMVRDVTARKREERERARLAAIVESTDAVVITVDTQGDIISANAAVERVYGYSRNELVGRHIRSLIPDDALEETKAFHNVLLSGQPISVETVRLAADGRQIDVSMSLFPVHDDAGELLCYASIARDIGERKRRERELARLAAIVQSSDDAIIALDTHGVIQFVNTGAERVYGYPASALIGKTANMLIPPDIHGQALEVRRDIVSGASRRLETVRLDAQGREVNVSLSVFPIRDAKGEVIGIASMSRDISDIKRQETEIARLAAIVESSDAAIIACDADHRIVAANRAAESMYGYSMETLLGQTPDLLIPEERRARAQQMYDEIFKHGVSERFETERVLADGSRLEVLMSVFPIHDREGSIIGVAASAQDISEQKRVQREMARLAAVVESSSDAVVSYDLEGRIISWNAGAERIFGYRPDEVLGQTALMFMSDDGEREKAATEHYPLLLSGNALGPRDLSLLHKDGSIVDVSATTFPIADDDGAVIGIGSIVRDIRDRKLAESALARLASVVEFSDDAIYVVSRTEGVQVWNRAAERLFGYAHLDIVEHGIASIVPAQDRATSGDIIRRTIDGETTMPRETVRLHRSGEAIEVSLSVFPVRDPGGEVVAVGAIARDIRQQKAAEAALRHAEQRVRAIAAGSPIALFEVDADGTMVFYEGSGLGEVPYDPTQLVGRSVWTIARDLPSIGENARRALAGESFVTNDYLGDLVYQTHHTPARDDDGNVTGFFGVSVDVTDRIRADQARRDAEALVKNVTENVPIVLFAVDTEGVFLLAEGMPLRSAGLGTEAFVGVPINRVLRDYPHAVEQIHHAIAGEAVQFEVENNGHYFDISVGPWNDGDGRARGAIGAAVDVTDRRNAERARREAEQRLQQLAAAAPVALFAMDKNGVLTYTEGALVERLSKFTRVRPGANLVDHYREHPSLAAPLRQALAGEFMRTELRLDGLTVEMHFTPMRDLNGEIEGIVGVAVDITDRSRAEEALLQAQKMESLAVLAGGIAHDFNNLLVGILGNAGLALSELPPDSPAQETIQDIEVAGRRAAELARQMLAYSGKGRLVTQSIDLSALVQEMHQLLRSYTHNAVTRFDLAENLPPVNADATQIRQVIMNLVINATDALDEEGGMISVSTGVMYADEEYLASTYLPQDQEPGNYVYLDVSDTGHGMSPETLARIFDPFFTTKFTGKGLGLAAVLGIVRGHGGAIKVESAPGEGTVFRLLLPVSDAAPAEEGTDRDENGPWRGSGTILVVDDEDSVRMVASRAIRSFGFDVEAYDDGLTGFEDFAKSPESFIAALIDVTMPRMSGHALLERIRELRSDLPVIFMSGYHEHEAVQQATASGEASFLQKPFSIGELRETLRRVLERAG